MWREEWAVRRAQPHSCPAAQLFSPTQPHSSTQSTQSAHAPPVCSQAENKLAREERASRAEEKKLETAIAGGCMCKRCNGGCVASDCQDCCDEWGSYQDLSASPKVLPGPLYGVKDRRQS